MGNDYYEAPTDSDRQRNGDPPLGIGAGTVIDGAIIDKNCRIGCNCRIVNEHGLGEHRRGPVRHDPRRNRGDPQGIVLPDNWTLRPVAANAPGPGRERVQLCRLCFSITLRLSDGGRLPRICETKPSRILKCEMRT